jgi:hypothetical protein
MKSPLSKRRARKEEAWRQECLKNGWIYLTPGQREHLRNARLNMP